MGYDATVYFTSGVRVPSEELDQVALALLGIDISKLNENDFDSCLQEGIPIPTPNMGSPYVLIKYVNIVWAPVIMIQLNSAQISVVRTADPPLEVQLPDQCEIDLFMNFVRSKNIHLPYGNYLVIAGGY